ncbi:MAG: hypothetical protein JSR29_13470 [Nitrospira sp.]|nr:hypothetical protein [Nitrospira sp.]
MDAKQKALVAGSLVLVWAGLAVSQWNLLEEPVRVPLTNITGPAIGGRQSEGRGGGLQVNLRLLGATVAQRDAPYTMPRNIFTMTSVDGGSPPNSDRGVVQVEEVPFTEPPAEQGGVVESGQLRYLGFLRMGEGPQRHKPMAVIRKDDDLLVLKAGDHIDGRFMLKKITPDSVTLRDSGAQVEHTVVLSEEAEVQE